MGRSFSVLGDIAILNFSEGVRKAERKRVAKAILEKNKSIKTVLEKSKNFGGRLRKMKTRVLAGADNKEVLYKENGCVFRFNVDETYFSPRLSNERKEVASKIKKGEDVLVMFAGVSPFPIVIAKNSKAGKIYSNEINRKANQYSKWNIDRNKVGQKVFLLPGDIKKVAERLKKQRKKFDVIVMPRPQLKDSFLKSAFDLSKKGTRIYYYDFCNANEISKIVDKIKREAKDCGKKIRILKSKPAGDIAPYKIRCRVDFKVV
ncbi:hypothetical protein B6U91_02150 [Candidatus Pacearchaeota archaeon ex4484_71]|nr:MAG: hypothetical protein B6U91_02150 [Candidatus Pacearchaeota archaeon ex4484_71]